MSVLRAEGITKDYPGTRALDNVSVSFEGGKVHAFIGKNGSGKSTLVKVFAGAIQPTEGHFFLDDQELKFNTPTDAFEQGIATVYQELSLVPYLTVAENIYLGRLPKKGRIVDWKKTYQQASDLIKKMNVDIDPREKVFKLSMWQCQVVEIIKAMSFKPKVLMLDEPTSALAQNETQSLFEVVRTLRDQGVIMLIMLLWSTSSIFFLPINFPSQGFDCFRGAGNAGGTSDPGRQVRGHFLYAEEG